MANESKAAVVEARAATRRCAVKESSLSLTALIPAVLFPKCFSPERLDGMKETLAFLAFNYSVLSDSMHLARFFFRF